MVIPAGATPSTVSGQIQFFISSMLVGASVKFKIAVAANDMAVLNSAIKLVIPDAVTPVPLLEFFVGPLPGVLPGFNNCQCLAF